MGKANHSAQQWRLATEAFCRMKVAFDRASRRQFALLMIRVVGAAVAFFTPILSDPSTKNGPLAAAFAGIALIICWHVVDHFYRLYRSEGEWARRVGLLAGGFDLQKELLATLEARLQRLPDPGNNPNLDGYDTKTPIGYQRLAEMIGERAGLTSGTYGKCHTQMICFLLVFALFTLVIIYFALSKPVQVAPELLIGYLGLGSAFVLPEGISLFRSYGGAARRTTNIHHNAVLLAASLQPDPGAVFFLVEDYTSAVESAPMFFPWVVTKFPK